MKLPGVVVGLGEVLWDIYPDEKRLGGAPSNTAIHVHRLGFKGVVASAVGQDQLGDKIIKVLKKQKIPISYIQRNSTRPTGTVGVRLNQDGIPHFKCSKDVAFDYLQWDHNLDKLAEEADAVFVGTLAQRNSVSHRTIQKFLNKAKRALKVFDVNFRGWNVATSRVVQETLANTDILKINEAELLQMQRAFCPEQRGIVPFLDWLQNKYNLSLVALSLGKRGCLLTNGKDCVLSPGIRVYPVDTTGCGDSFAAGLIVKYFGTTSLEEIAEFANYVGAFVATMKGAVPEYKKEDLEQFIDTHRERIDMKL